MKIPPYIAAHLQPALRDTLEPWQLKEVVCLCKHVAADAVARARQHEKPLLNSLCATQPIDTERIM